MTVAIPGWRRLRNVVMVALAVLAASPAQAGSIAISLTIPSLAQISGLNDVSFSNLSVTSDAVNSQSVCAYSNTATRAYTVTATGSGAGSAFSLAAASLPTVAYAVGWAGTAGSATTTNLVAGAPSAPFTGAAIVPGCTIGGSSATLTVTIPAARLQTMTSGATYTGTLTLVITPS